MGYALLWLETMASALLLVALVFSVSGRLKKRKTLWPILLAVVLFLLGVSASTILGFLFFWNIHPQWLFPYTLSWTLLFPFAVWWVIRRGRQPRGDISAAAAWPRAQLAGAWLVILTLQWATMDTLDNSRTLEALAAQTTVESKFHTILPSPPPSDQDAFPLYDQAIRELGAVPIDGLWDSSFNPAFDPTSEQAQTILQEKTKAIHLLKKASQKPHYYEPLVLYMMKDWIPPRHDRVHRLLALEARSQAVNGHLAAALDSISSLRKYADHLLQTPTWINVRMAGWIHVNSKKALEIILAEGSGSPAIPIHPPANTQDHLVKALHKSFIFEEAFLMSELMEVLIKYPSRNLYSLNPFFPEPEAESVRYYLVNKLYRIFFLEADVAFMEVFWNKVQSFTRQPFFKVRKEWQEWEADLYKNTRLGLLNALFLNPNNVTRNYDKVHQAQTHILLADLGLAAAAYHARHQTYPATLDALVPDFMAEIPRDPFDGHPLKMFAREGGLILYSVGPDQTDDGGAEYDRTKETGDLTFCLGSAFEERRLQPALEKNRQAKKGEN